MIEVGQIVKVGPWQGEVIEIDESAETVTILYKSVTGNARIKVHESQVKA